MSAAGGNVAPPSQGLYKRPNFTRGPWLKAVRCPAPKAGLAVRGGSTGEYPYGAARFQHASAIRSWRAFRPSIAPLESEDGGIHLRHPQQYPHHRSDLVGADA